MSNFAHKVESVFNSYKCKNPEDEIKLIPIFKNEKLTGILFPVTFHYKSISPQFIGLFSKWRKENPEGFASVFEITDQRTENWLDNVLLKRADRILFVICNINLKPIGHLGLSSFDFRNNTCEIDNVVRGVKNRHPGLMSDALQAIIKWGVSMLPLNDIFLRVLEDNPHAILFYKNNGFIITEKIPLYKTETEDEVKWTENPPKTNIQSDRTFVKMKFKSI